MRYVWMKPLALLLLLLTFLAGVAAGEEARDIAAGCKLSVSRGGNYRENLLSADLQEYWPAAPGATLTVETRDGSLAQGVVVSFASAVPTLRVEADGEVIAEYAEEFRTNYVPFTKAVSRFTITLLDGPADVRMNRLQVLSLGEIPDWVQRWERLEGAADIMLVATHPDDELLWFGGLLPMYAGEYQKKVIVVHTVGSSAFRHNELLAALWTCGVRYYPVIGTFPDRNVSTRKECLKNWGGEEKLQKYIVEQMRKYRPSVVVTQGIDGESKHMHHKLTVQAVIDAVTELSGDASWDAATAGLYGAWQPKKLYVHLWGEDQTVFNWRQPLSAFGGEDALSVAKRAFKMHRSQQTGRYSVEDSGQNDCRIFGLYWSSVGADEAHDDLLEHIE